IISLEFAEGSIASIQYYTNGHRSFPKERVEVFASGRILQLENFRTLRGFGCSRLKNHRTWRQDKGHDDCVNAFLHAVVSGGPSPIPAEEIFEVSRFATDVAEAVTRTESRCLNDHKLNMTVPVDTLNAEPERSIVEEREFIPVANGEIKETGRPDRLGLRRLITYVRTVNDLGFAN